MDCGLQANPSAKRTLFPPFDEESRPRQLDAGGMAGHRTSAELTFALQPGMRAGRFTKRYSAWVNVSRNTALFGHVAAIRMAVARTKPIQ
jgi:hypothetical protein